ncbi:MAG: DUF732 domain-containing protein [Mycobacterium sp.]
MFSNHRFVVAATVGAAALGLAALAACGTAAANSTDDAFIAQMKAVGVTFSSPQIAVQDAHQVCKELAGGKTGSEVANEVVSQTDLSPKQAAIFVGNATQTYCPQYGGVSA